MAVVTIENAANTNDYYLPDLFEFDTSDPNLDLDEPIVSETRFEVTVQREPGLVTIAAIGTGFTFYQDPIEGSGPPVSGVVNTMTLSVNGVLWMTITGLSVELTDLDHFMFGW
ncbi:MAG: hypothetical protein C0427_06750, partial [Rhodobacter sp.]|nr:hypothetical protein [Rhodobacter sp.]